MSTRQQDMPQDAMQDHLIADYLRNNPEFFNTHARLLAELRVPHQAHGAVSLIERQLTVLRDQNLELKRQLQALVQVARDNARLNDRIQHFTLGLLEARDLATTLQVVTTGFRNAFHADGVALCLFRHLLPLGRHHVPEALTLREVAADAGDNDVFATVLATGKPLCGHLRRGQAVYLFGEQAEMARSAVVLTLNAGSGGARLGLLGVASHDATRYHAGMGTLFLGHLGDLIGRALARHLPALKIWTRRRRAGSPAPRSPSGCRPARSSPRRARPRCSSTIAVGGCRRAPCSSACAAMDINRDWTCRCIRTCCATRAPATCWKQAATSAPCRSCSAMPTSPLPRSTPTSTFSISPKSTIRRIRARAKKAGPSAVIGRRDSGHPLA